MPSSSGVLSITRQQLIVGATLLIVLIAGAFYWQSTQSRGNVDTEKSAGQQAAEDIAKSENPFESESALAEVEADPLTKTKAVLNPF